MDNPTLENRRPFRRLFLELAAVLALTALIEWYYFGFCNTDLAVPNRYEGDGLTGVSSIKNALHGSGALLGWPYYQDSYAYSANYSMLKTVFIWLCGLFCGNASTVFDLYQMAIPFANVAVCFLVLRSLKMRGWLAYLAALAFGFCPYVQQRFIGHMALASVECIPLVFLMCIWCIEDDSFNRPGRGWARKGRNWLALLFAWMIANNGMVYYPFFSCFILCVVALCLLLRRRNWRAAVPALVVVAEIAGWLAVGFLPVVIGMIRGYGNAAAAGAVRTAEGALIYGLRLSSLLLSPNGYGIPKIASWFGNYFNLSAQLEGQNVNENVFAYMGMAAVAGFFLLLVNLFFREKDSPTALGRRLWYLSRVNIAIVLLGVQTGLGSIIGAFLTYIRAYNRISPFLVFCGVLTVTLLAEALLQKLSARRKAAYAGAALLVAGLFGYALWEQQGCYNYLTEEYTRDISQRVKDDQAFVGQIEAASGEDALVYQLPYMRSFENGAVYDINDYDHMRGEVNSDTLRWSYGATDGTENDRWYARTSRLEPSALVAELYDKGFAGIWLNLAGYAPEERARTEADLCAAAFCDEPIRCGDGHTIYIPLSHSLVYQLDPATGGVRGIDYQADEDVVRVIGEDLAGDESAVTYLQNALQSEGTDGQRHTIALPEGCELRFATPEDRGEMTAAATVVEEHDFSLSPADDVQIASFPFAIEGDTCYRVDLTLDEDTDLDAACRLMADLYADGYDRQEQQVEYFVSEGRYQYSFYIDSGNIPAGSIDGNIRLFTGDLTTLLKIDTLRVTQMTAASQPAA